MGPTLFVCTNRRQGGTGSCAGAGGGLPLLMALRDECEARGLRWQVSPSVCLGHCAGGPNIKAAPAGPLLQGCRPDRVAALVDQLLAAGWPGD